MHAGPVDIIPGILNLGNGQYSCAFTPVKVGSYTLTIKVGRGGTDFQDIITGFDLQPTNSLHEFQELCIYDVDGMPSCRANPNPYTLLISPGATSPKVTTAVGDSLSLSTAGVMNNFVITAKDSFGNRRPGGDAVSVLMELWGAPPSAAPKTKLACKEASALSLDAHAHANTYIPQMLSASP